MLPALRYVTGASVEEVPKATPWEDFSFFAQEMTDLYVLTGASENPAAAAPNHSPEFLLDENSLLVGVRTLLNLAFGHMEQDS